MKGFKLPLLLVPKQKTRHELGGSTGSPLGVRSRGGCCCCCCFGGASSKLRALSDVAFRGWEERFDREFCGALAGEE